MNHSPIFIATHDADEYVELIESELGSELDITTATSKKVLKERYQNQPILLARPDYAAIILEDSPPVSWVQSTWAGVTPLIKCPYKNYQLAGVKGVFGEPMAEFVIGHILAHELKIEWHREIQANKKWDMTSNGRLRGKTMGVMGTGSIGETVAETARKLGINVIGFNSSGESTEVFQTMHSADSLKEFLRACDYVVGILPDVPATTNLLDATTLNCLKDTALLINVGRGNLIDEVALVAALNEGKFAAAVIDVFKKEPLVEESPLWSTPNLSVTCHTAAVSVPENIAGLFIQNYQRYVAGESLLNLVDFDKGY
jgi:phosphoglycerate dehydrogenase-like enzyme